jgi:hypothetical protein
LITERGTDHSFASLRNLKLSKLCINLSNLSISAILLPTTAPIPIEIPPHAPIPIPISDPQRTGAKMVQISEVKGTNRDNRTAAHTHIKGLGLNNGVAEKQAAGFVGQTDAREVSTLLGDFSAKETGPPTDSLDPRRAASSSTSSKHTRCRAGASS